MSQFDQALTLVLDTLTQRQARVSKHDRPPSASLDSLRKLVESAPKGRLSVARPTSGTPVAKTAAPAAESAATPARPAGSLTSRFSELRATLGDPKATRAQAAAEAPAVQTPPPTASIPPSAPQVQQVASRAEKLAQLRERIASELTPEIAFGVGNPDAELIFIGDAPKADEALPGDPFVGKAGQLLTKIIEAMGFRRENVYITNLIKTSSGTSATQLPYLVEEIGIIQPKCIVSLGEVPIAELTGSEAPIDDLRGRWHSFKGIPLMATFHPEYLLQNQSITEKRKLWEDLLQVLELLGRPITPKQRGFFLSKG